MSVVVPRRPVMLAEGIGSADTFRKAIGRMSERGVVHVLDPGGKREAARYLLRVPAGVSTQVSSNLDHKGNKTPTVRISGPGSRTLPTNRMRAPHPATNAPLSRLPVKCAHVLDLIIYQFGGVATLDEIASRLRRPDSKQPERKQRHNVRTRYLAPMVSVGLLSEHDGRYALPTDAEERLAEYLDLSGCDEAERLQRARFEREQQAREQTPDDLPTPPDDTGHVPDEPAPLPEENPVEEATPAG